MGGELEKKKESDFTETTASKAHIAGIAIGFLFLFVFLATLIYCMFPVEILAYLMRCFPSWYTCCPCKSTTYTNKPYDLFIAYNRDSQAWIENELIPFLESQDDATDFTYFLHYDEYENPAAEVFGPIIKDKINNSAIVLLILSDKFLIDEWANEELREYIRQAVAKSTRHSKEKTRLVSIQLEDVSDEEVEEYVRERLQIPSITSLETEEFLFWYKLEYFLHNNRDTGEIYPVLASPEPKEIELNTRDPIGHLQPNDLLNFRHYDIPDAPIVHMPSDRPPAYNVNGRIKQKAIKNSLKSVQYRNEGYEDSDSPIEYPPSLVQQSILAQLAAKKNNRVHDDVVVNLDNPVRYQHQKNDSDPVILKTRKNHLEFAIQQADSSYRLVNNAKTKKGQRFKEKNMLSDDSEYSF